MHVKPQGKQYNKEKRNAKLFGNLQCGPSKRSTCGLDGVDGVLFLTYAIAAYLVINIIYSI